MALVLSVGYLDFVVSLFGFNFLGRSLFDRVDIGSRFHSLFHEPRDDAVASAYLIALLCTVNISKLSRVRLPKVNFNIKTMLLGLLLVSPFLSKSASFVLGLLLFAVFSLVYAVIQLCIGFQRVPAFLFGIFIFFCLLIILANLLPLELILDERTLLYYNSFQTFISSLKSREIMQAVIDSPLLILQASTFVPIVAYFNSISLHSLYPTFFGYGHGYISNLLSVEIFNDNSDIYNSFAGFPRLLCETGFLGLISFFYMYFTIILKPLLNISSLTIFPLFNKSKVLYLLSSFLLFSMYLIHRRQELFLFMGFVNCFLASSRTHLNPSSKL